MEKHGPNGPKHDSEALGVTEKRQANCLDSQQIFGTRAEILIQHGDQIYRLRKTRRGKLILNK
ncbi:MAG: hemin uptake protein HemP [Phycisphaerales bacterium]|nr:MAG: hemin uptake protein HemP [Phycisphaerales bacterium]